MRVAFFTDSFHEVNGVALTSREFARFSSTQGLPFFSVHPGPQTRHWSEGSFETLEIGNSACVMNLERDLHFDLGFLRHRAMVRKHLERFAPNVVHITGPGHAGLLGALLAHDLGIPLAASWHTNLHEYSARRLNKLLTSIAGGFRESRMDWAEHASLAIVLRFYRTARVLFAPNQELVDLLARGTGKPVHLMQRGIDWRFFRPDRRVRRDGQFVIGYVGRLSPEKNVRQFAALERALETAGALDFRLTIVGDGSEREWLGQNLKHADLPGILVGDALADAYAQMDVFAFPSETDTYGNVVSEAQSSGVPAVVMEAGGPKFLVESGVSGFVAKDADRFAAAVLQLFEDRRLLAELRRGARGAALERSWDEVFQEVYGTYAEVLAPGGSVSPGLKVF